MIAIESDTKWKEDTIKMFDEVGVDDYHFDTQHSCSIRSIDPAKIKPVTRPLNIDEQQTIYCIYELTGVRVPVLDPSSQEFLYKSIFSHEELSQILEQHQ